MKKIISKKRVIILLIIVMLLFIGIAIPKLTVQDTVSVDKEFRETVMQTVATHYDNPLEKFALILGKSRILKVSESSAEVESFTIFRVPLGFFRGIPDMRLLINFNLINDWPTEYIPDISPASTDVNLDSKQENNDLWQTFTDQEQNIEFKYPKDLTAKYISTVEWPPVVMVRTGSQLECSETPVESSLPERIMRRQVDDRMYCVLASSEGAAGSVYTKYYYLGVWNEKIVRISFTLRYPQCYNYDEPKQTECINEREVFDLDGVVDRIFISLRELND